MSHLNERMLLPLQVYEVNLRGEEAAAEANRRIASVEIQLDAANR